MNKPVGKINKKGNKAKINFLVLSNISFIIWAVTILFFGFLISIDYESNKILSNLILPDILLGILAFILGFVFRPSIKSDSNKLQKKEIKKIVKTEKNDITKKFLTILLGIIILLSAVLYVRAESKDKELRNKDFGSNLKPTPTKLLQPTPTSKPKNQPSANTNNTGLQVDCIGPDGKQFRTSMDECKKLNEKWGKPTDYIITCNIHVNCGGGNRQIKKSECDNSTCCQVGGKWIWYMSKAKCKQDQGVSASNSYSLPANYPSPTYYHPCTIYYPSLGYSQTYNYMTAEQCAQSKKDLTIPVIPTPTIDQSAVNAYNQLLKDHQAACDQAAADWVGIREQFEATQFNNYSSSAEAVIALLQRMAQYQQELYDAGCSNKISL